MKDKHNTSELDLNTLLKRPSGSFQDSEATHGQLNNKRALEGEKIAALLEKLTKPENKIN